ncbi:MAG: N-6 DNA methylase [Sulfolobales archaeon]|nr:SAM-dependent methyltransferase [Sulfolobales archaeon]MDW8082486.1 N-6 DNA methylase [Sulfolobales archaeon]
MSEELHPESLRYIASSSLEYRVRVGQFFTPRSLREEVLSKIPRSVQPRVLDPACGTGEFLLSARDYFINPELHCWEIDPKPAEVASRVVPEARVEVVDSLTKPFKEEFDVVVTNPPYFEFNPDEKLRARFKEILYGRVNVYSLFVYLALKLVKAGGYVGLVVSSSMNNGAYFKKLREFVVKTASIEYLRVVEDSHIFPEVNHVFQVLVLRKYLPGEQIRENYVLRYRGFTVLSEKAGELTKLLENSLTLEDLGYEVVTGRVVWNEHRDKLTRDSESGILLIWSHNIKSGKLVLDNKPERPQYVKWPLEKAFRGPAIVVTRVVGHPKRANLEAALVPDGVVFVAENHVNVVIPPKDAVVDELREIVEWLNSEKAQSIVRALTGNTQLSKSELKHLIPIPIDKPIGRTARNPGKHVC